MPLTPGISVDRFDGLRLDVPPALVGAGSAIDLLDVDWDTRGVLGSRMGAEKFTTKDPGENYDVLWGHSIDFEPFGEVFALLARRGETLVKVNAAGEEEGGTLAVGASRLNFAKIGEATLLPITYIAAQDHHVRKFEAGAFSEPTATVDGVAGKAMPKAQFVANWQDGGNRLVVANTNLEGGPAEAAGSPSHVFFSEPGQPEHFESTAYVQLNPGDGQQITGMATWGRNLFVFKETYCFVFYGISADEEGKPIFNFSTVDLGTRVVAPPSVAAPHVLSGREGVYFVGEDGIWVTTGGMPTLVTHALDFSEARREPRSELGGFPLPRWFHVKGLCLSGECLYVGFQEGGAYDTSTAVERLLKIDLRTERITYWKVKLNALLSWASSFGEPPKVFFSAAKGKKGIYFFSPEANEDPTVEMDPYWQSGWYDLGNPDEKTLTQMKMWGSGTVKVAVAEDFGEPGNAKTFKLGTGSVISRSDQQRGQDATVFSHRLSGEAPWSIQRLTRYLRETRVEATQRKS